MAFVDPFKTNKENTSTNDGQSTSGFVNPFLSTNQGGGIKKGAFANFDSALKAQNTKPISIIPSEAINTPVNVKVEDKNWLSDLFSNTKKTLQFASPAVDYAKAGVKATAGVVSNKVADFYQSDSKINKALQIAIPGGLALELDKKKEEKTVEQLKTFSTKAKESAIKSQNIGEEKVKKIGAREGFWGLTDQVILSAPSLITSLGIGTAATIVSKNPFLGISLGFSNSFAQEAGSAYLDARKNGADEETAENVAIGVGTINGLIESVPVGKILNRVAKATKGEVTKEVLKKSILKNATQQIILEGGTESIQEVVSNAVALTYDQNRELLSGVGQSFLVGGILGGISSVSTDTGLTILSGNTSNDSGIKEINKKIEKALETPKNKRTDEQKQIIETLYQKEYTPDQAISTVINTGIQNTPIGKEIMKSVLIAKESGNNIKISSIDGENVEIKLVDLQESIKNTEDYVNQKLEKFREIKPDSLSQEARKYKSAEEFVKAQGTPVYHGTSGDFEIFAPKTGKEKFAGQAGTFFTTNQTEASGFGKNIKETYISPNAKIKVEYASDMSPEIRAEKIFKARRDGYDAVQLKSIQLLRGIRAEISKLDNEINKLKPEIDRLNQRMLDGEITPEQNLSDPLMKKWSALLEQRNPTHTIVFNTDVLKTKSQLTDIWNKANKAKTEKKSVKPRPEELDPETLSLLTSKQAEEARLTQPVDKRTEQQLKDRLEELEIKRTNIESSRAILSNFDSDTLKGLRRVQRALAVIEKRGGDPTEVTTNSSYQRHIEDLMAFLNTTSEDKAIDYLLNDFPEPIRRVSTKEDLEEIRYLKSKLKPKEVEVPRDQIPVGRGKEKVSRLEARVKNVLKNAPEEVRDNLGLSTYNQMNKADQIRKATEYVAENPNDALKIIKGDLEAPQGILKNSIYVALENYAVLGKDMNLARKIASLESTRLGQEISILSEMNIDSPVKIIRDVIKVREEAFENRYRGKSAKKVSSKIVKDIQKRVKTPDKYDWNKFVESIKC